MNRISEPEKIAVFYAANAPGKIDWYALYNFAHLRPDNKDIRDNAGGRQQVSKWKHADHIQTYLQQCQAERARQDQTRTAAAIAEERAKGTSKGNEGTDGTGTGAPFAGSPDALPLSDFVNFADREQFINYLSRTANRITDDKLRADYLKMLADLERFKETRTNEENDLQRFYAPLQCSACPLYKREKGDE